MESLFPKVIGLAISIIFFIGIWQVVSTYARPGEKVTKPIKNFIIVLLFLGAAPSLANSAPQVGETLVKPIVAIVQNVSESISSDMQSELE